jgi:hypothetical protein
VVKRAEFTDGAAYVADPGEELEKLGMAVGTSVRVTKANLM